MSFKLLTHVVTSLICMNLNIKHHLKIQYYNMKSEFTFTVLGLKLEYIHLINKAYLISL